MTRHRIVIAMLTLAAILSLGVSPFMHWRYWLLYNPSESAPRGWYAVGPIHSVQVDDLVVVRLPRAISTFAAQRKYLPLDVPLVKHVSAVGGQKACARDGVMLLDDQVIARAHELDGLGRRLDAWTGCRMLAADEVLLISTTSDASFDSRYFGPIHRTHIVGRATPLWTWAR